MGSGTVAEIAIFHSYGIDPTPVELLVTWSRPIVTLGPAADPTFNLGAVDGFGDLSYAS
jgi:hypothetical protein